MNVVVLHWPSEDHRVGPLRAMGIPRRLLVDRDEPPPVYADPLADWALASAAEDELAARVAALAARARARTTARPVVDAAGMLHCRDETLALSPKESQITRCFLEQLDHAVSRAQLAHAAWSGHEVQPKTVEMHIPTLRRRLAPAGLSIATVRARGWVLRTVNDDEA